MHPVAVRRFLKLLCWPSQLPIVAQSHSMPPWGLVTSHPKSSARVSSTKLIFSA